MKTSSKGTMCKAENKLRGKKQLNGKPVKEKNTKGKNNQRENQ